MEPIHPPKYSFKRRLVRRLRFNRRVEIMMPTKEVPNVLLEGAMRAYSHLHRCQNAKPKIAILRVPLMRHRFALRINAIFALKFAGVKTHSDGFAICAVLFLAQFAVSHFLSHMHACQDPATKNAQATRGVFHMTSKMGTDNFVPSRTSTA